MLRIGQVLAEARSMMNPIKSYGNPDVVYSFPTSAIPPDVGKKETGRASVKEPSPTPSAGSRSLTTTVRTLARAFRLSMDSPSVRRRKCRSYKSFERAARAGLRRTSWVSAPFCIIQTPIQTIKLIGRVLHWGWLWLQWGLLNGNKISYSPDTKIAFITYPRVRNPT